jgi:hypothetical protein
MNPVWLWFNSPHNELAASMMRTFEPPHGHILYFGAAIRMSAPAGGIALASEYAKCKNRHDFRQTAMTDDPSQPDSPASAMERKLSPAAQRALAEAEARRQAARKEAKSSPKEFQGPTGPEPTRYGDWEKKGIASDF